MDASTKNRLLGLLVALTALYAAVTVITFFTTGGFGSIWFAASLAVYAVIAVAGVGVALLDARTSEDTAVEPAGSRAGERLRHEATTTVYATPTGRVLRAQFSNGDRSEEVLFAVTPDEVLPAEDIERRLDALDIEPEGPISDETIERALARQRDRDPNPQVDPAEIAVVLLDRRNLYEASTGQVVHARWRTPLGEREGLFVVDDRQAVPIEAVERRLDELDQAPSPLGDEAAIQASLDDHELPGNSQDRRTEDVIQT